VSAQMTRKWSEPSISLEMNDQPLPPLHGAPVRLRIEHQLGFTMVMWIQSIETGRGPQHDQACPKAAPKITIFRATGQYLMPVRLCTGAAAQHRLP
jgi:DMSO/TMAO reductase YedYZ molybdopterin-dependent catalytic subunit